MASQLSQQYACKGDFTPLISHSSHYLPLESALKRTLASLVEPQIISRSLVLSTQTFQLAPTTTATMEGFLLMLSRACAYWLMPLRLFLYIHSTFSVRIFQAEGAKLLQELNISNILELQFSPRGTYISTWERPGTYNDSNSASCSPHLHDYQLNISLPPPVKLDDGAQHKNLRIFSVSTGEELIAFTQKSHEGWDLQYTISESHAIRLVSQEIQVFRPAEWGKGVIDKLRVEGASMVSLSPGLNPSIAVFVAEKKV